jgi:phage terminase small subunit
MALTPQQELFARYVVELSNQSAAYRKAYDVGPGTKWTTVSSEASKLVNDPEISARIRELQDAAAAVSAIPALVTRIRELREIESADPNEIISLIHRPCRHCRGVDHRYQWRDDVEYATACDTAIKLKQSMPDMSGGFGYDGSLDPVPECPVCFGDGIRDVRIADTSKLTGAARRLYKGVKIKGNGDIELLMHDQMQARDMLNRIMGAYKDGAALTPPGLQEAAKAVEQQKTPEERQRAYLRLVSA